MEIRIRKLTPELADDYVRFFDETPHDDGAEENKCYCVCWCSADHRVATDFSSREKRRNLAVEYVKSGAIQGYLAYAGDRIVGWCNANAKSDCLHCTSWLRFMKPVAEAVPDEPGARIKSVFCFVIAPDMRRQGVAKRLLQQVCADAAAEGFDCIEAYPNKIFVSESGGFMGPAALYAGCGFTPIAEAGEKCILRKTLATDL